MVNKPTDVTDEEQVRQFFVEIERESLVGEANIKVINSNVTILIDGFTTLSEDVNLPTSARTTFENMANSLKEI